MPQSKLNSVYGLQTKIYDSKSMKKTTKKVSSPNTFYMKGGPETQYKHTRIVDFQPEKATGYVHSSMKQLKKQSLIPTFNLDLFMFHPSRSMKSIIDKNLNKSYPNTNKLTLSISQMVPKPRNKDYCNVCQAKFDNYFQHSCTSEHIEELNKNKFQKRILKLCRRFQRKLIKAKKAQDLCAENESCSQSQYQQSVRNKIKPLFAIE